MAAGIVAPPVAPRRRHQFGRIETLAETPRAGHAERHRTRPYTVNGLDNSGASLPHSSRG